MPRQIVGLVLAVLILASLFGGRSLVANVADGPQHVVKPGETLSAIAAQYGLTVDQLMSVNGLTDPGLAGCLGTNLLGSQTLDVFLFDRCFENYFWNYDNNGLKNLEVRFYKAP